MNTHRLMLFFSSLFLFALFLAACQPIAEDPVFVGHLTRLAEPTPTQPTATTISPSVTITPTRDVSLLEVTPTLDLPATQPPPPIETIPTLTPIPTATPVRELVTALPLVEPTGTPTPTSPPPTVAGQPQPIAAPPLNPAGIVGLGAYLDGTPYDGFAAANNFQSLIGHRLRYLLWFQAWGDTDREFLASAVQAAAAQNHIPIITWEPWKRNFADPAAEQPDFSLASIAAGDHNAYISGWARAAAQSGVPIIIRFAHEQSTEPGTRSWYPWQGDPEGYRAAFRHVVAQFRAAGATNVQFLWSAMWLESWASAYYPGNDVVDYVGTTVLNHGTAVNTAWAQWRTFDELFSGQYQAAVQFNKPMILTELATAEQGGNKATWIRDFLASLQPSYPRVVGVLLLEVESDREWPAINWSVGSSPASLLAFREGINNPHFK